jgi:xylan 1,4-beta-xylosidase
MAAPSAAFVAILTALIVATPAPSASIGRRPAESAATVRVDFAEPVQNQPSMVGFLHGMNQTTPPDEMIRPLRPVLWRGLPRTAPYDRARDFGARYVLLLSDAWGYPPMWSKGRGAPYKHLREWAQFVRTVARQSRGRDMIFDVWNEPDSRASWVGSREQLFKTYAVAARVLHEELGDDVQVIGPSLGVYNAGYIGAFLDACRSEPGCRVSALAWHEFPAPSPPISTIVDHLRDARHRFLERTKYASLGLQGVYVGESVNAYSQYRPGEILAYLSALERGGADGAARACWIAPNGDNQCFNHTLDGLVTPGTSQPRAAWWTYKLYADGVSSRVRTSTHDSSVAALASSESALPGAPQILVGRFSASPDTHGTTSVSITLRGLDALPRFASASRVTIVVRQIPDQGTRPLSSPKLVMQEGVPVIGSRAHVIIPGFRVHDLYAVDVVAPA